MRRLGHLLAIVVSIVLAILFACFALMLAAATGSRHGLLQLTVAIAASWKARHTLPA